MIERIERSTLGEMVLNRLGAQIRAGAFPSGSRLPPERALAARFGVSRGAVREAFRALALVGLVEIRPGRGTFVCEVLPATAPDVSPAQVLAYEAQSLREVYHARRLIETELILLAMDHLTDDDLARLDTLLEQMRAIDRRNGDRSDFARLHFEFDGVIAAAARNRVLRQIFQQLRDVELAAHEQMLRVPGAMQISNLAHEKLLSALRSGRRDAVSKAAREHFDVAEHTLGMVEALGEAMLPVER